jgi:multiple sugar transport system substrate-binding protein
MTERITKSLTRRNFLQMVGAGSAAMALAACAAPISPAAAPAAQSGAGAEAGAAAQSGQAFLNYWTGWSGFEYDELQKMVDKFNESHPEIFVNMSTVFGQYEKVLTAIAGGNPPDVVSAVWLRQLVSMAARNGLQPVTDYAEAAGITGEGYFPQFWNAWQYEGDLWGLMITSNSQVVAYRPDLFTEVGLDPAAPPQTTTELDAAAQALEKMDANGNIERVGILPAGLTWWGRVFGGSFYDEANKKITANDPKIVAALDWEGSYRQRLGPEKVAAFQSGFGDYMSTQNSFFAGKEAMTQVGEWFIQFQKQFAPDLVMEFIPAPYPEGGRPNTTTFDGSVFTIPAGVKNPDASWEFIRWLSEDQNMGDFCFAIQNVPPKLAPASEDRFVADPRFQLAVDLLNGENAFGPDKMPVNDLLFTRLAEAESAVFNGELTAQEALDRVTQEVQAELDKMLN